MKYFIFAIVFLFSITDLQAQDFFIPDGAFLPATEKLKPLKINSDSKVLPYQQGRYKLIDGRVFAIEDEPDDPQQIYVPTDEYILSEQPSSLPDKINDQQLSNTQPLNTENIEISKVLVSPPFVDPVDKNLPAYKNRYALYLADLEKFQKTGTMPENPDLKATLKKLATPREIILFEGEVD